MNKSEMADKLAGKADISKAQAAEIIDHIFSTKDGEGIIAVELDPDPIKRITYGANSPMIFDHLEDRNLAAYENILTPARSRFEPARRVEYLEEGSKRGGPEKSENDTVNKTGGV